MVDLERKWRAAKGEMCHKNKWRSKGDGVWPRTTIARVGREKREDSLPNRTTRVWRTTWKKRRRSWRPTRARFFYHFQDASLCGGVFVSFTVRLDEWLACWRTLYRRCRGCEKREKARKWRSLALFLCMSFSSNVAHGHLPAEVGHTERVNGRWVSDIDCVNGTRRWR